MPLFFEPVAGKMRLAVCLAALLAALAGCGPAREEPVHVAVAANFADTAKEIADLFARSSGHQGVLSSGATGQLYTQITQAAPFEVFLAADQETPGKVVSAGLGVKDSQFTYAIGKLVLFSPALDLSDGEAVLRGAKFAKIAIANPATAPYGQAAIEVLKALSLSEQLAGKIVQGNSIAQAFQFVETANAELGFVAGAQVLGKESKSIWMVPRTLYSPIRQDAVLLNKGAANGAARAFMAFLKSPDARKVIAKYGYAEAP